MAGEWVIGNRMRVLPVKRPHRIRDFSEGTPFREVMRNVRRRRCPFNLYVCIGSTPVYRIYYDPEEGRGEVIVAPWVGVGGEAGWKVIHEFEGLDGLENAIFNYCEMYWAVRRKGEGG